ncbi:MAG: integrase [Magnetococcales bacterium]|nr:integrase [Magnetococcales bacterium]MBF0321978.1 integrase [Magnetococcales bacterium]
MTTMISEVYDALISAGADDTKARSATEAIAKHDANIVDGKARLVVIQWAVGYLVAAITALVIKAFT